MRSHKKDLITLVWTWIAALAAALFLQNEVYGAGISDKIFTQSMNYTDIKLLTNNTDSFKERLKMIDNAKKNVDMVYFIWEADYTSSLFMQKILLRADQGIKFRILVDYMETEAFVPALLTLANHLSNGEHNIEVKRYRPPTKKLMTLLHNDGIKEYKFIHALMILDKQAQKDLLDSLSTSRLAGDVKNFIDQQKAKNEKPNFGEIVGFVVSLLNDNFPSTARELITFLKRSHYKLLLVDDKKFMLGGRNISDQYHTEGNGPLLQQTELNGPRYTFQDTDLEATEGTSDPIHYLERDNFIKLWTYDASVNVTDSSNYYDEKGQTLPPPLPEKTIFERAWQAHLLGFDDGIMTSSTLSMAGPLEGQIFENGPMATGSLGPLSYDPLWLPQYRIYRWDVYNWAVLLREIANEYVKLINAATTRIDIVTAYFYIDDGFKDGDFNAIFKALKAKAAKGVKVNVYTNSPESTDLAVVNEVSFRKYQDLKKAGILVHELAPGQGSLHTKVMTIDDNIMAVGSFNLDPRSQMSDTNNIIVLRDDSQTLVRHFREERGVPNDQGDANSTTGLKWKDPSDDEIETWKNKLKDVPDAVFNELKFSI